MFSMLNALCKIWVSNPKPPEDCSVNLAACDQGSGFFGFNVTIEEDGRSFDERMVRSKDIVLGRAEFACTKSSKLGGPRRTR
jgi:hypothetical protein